MDGETKTATDSGTAVAGQISVAESIPTEPAATSADKAGSPSTETPKTYTEEEHQRELNQKHSKLDKRLSEQDKTITELTERLNNYTKQEEERRRAELAREEEEVKNDPAKYNTFKQKKELLDMRVEIEKREADLKKSLAEHADKLKRADELEVETKVINTALKNHVDIEMLRAKCQKYNLSTEDQIDDMAKTLASAGKAPPPSGGTGKSIGGQDYEKLSPREKIEMGLEKSKKK